MQFGRKIGVEGDEDLRREAEARFDDYELNSKRTSGEFCDVHFTELPLTGICPECED